MEFIYHIFEDRPHLLRWWLCDDPGSSARGIFTQMADRGSIYRYCGVGRDGPRSYCNQYRYTTRVQDGRSCQKMRLTANAIRKVGKVMPSTAAEAPGAPATRYPINAEA